jgi:chaperonin GroES
MGERNNGTDWESAPMTEAKMTLETIEPVGMRVLIRKDEERRTTRGGIHLPDDSKTPVLTGRVVAISAQIDSDPDYPLQRYDKVLIDPRNGIPVDFEQDNKLFIIPIDDVVAVFRKEAAPAD